MKTKLLVLALLAGGSMFAQTRFSFGINIGGRAPGYYAQAPAYAGVRPPCPGPDYSWVDGYWGQNYGRNVWVPGYWNRVPYARAYQAPRYEQPRYDERYERRFDRDRDRDWDHDRDRRYGQDYGRGYEHGFRGR
jgi:hypothetical protein